MNKVKLKANPVELFWRKASCWRKLSLLRSLNAIKTSIAQKHIEEMIHLRRNNGGFSRNPNEASSVAETAEAIMNLIKAGKEPNSPIVQQAVIFLWSVQKENGSWRENPQLPKDKIPFWSSSEKGVPILTADCIEALIDVGYRDHNRVKKAVDWLKQMQSSTGMWITLEDAGPNDTEPDSTQRAISALIKFGMPADSQPIKKACEALENFILKEALEWAKTYVVWSWIAPLEGLIAAGYTVENKAVQYALKNILEQQLDDGSWPNGYELRVVPTLINLGIISKRQALEIISESEKSA